LAGILQQKLPWSAVDAAAAPELQVKSRMTARRSAAPARHALPGAARLDRRVFLRPVAHRGLHGRASGRLENTAPAFLAAVDKGYGIECDLQAAKDGTPMVFHDDTLDRLVAASGRLDAYSPAELARVRYRRQDTHILTFAELLDLVAGRVPLLVEVKAHGKAPPKTFLDKIARQARAYKGPIALMSFNRHVVAELGRLAPTVPRGLVVGTHQLRPAWWAAPNLAARSQILERLLGSALAGVDFLAVDVRMLRSVRAWIAQHAPELALFSWTIRTARERLAARHWADAAIFEGYEP
jgi:glycerophosphoryl diester phosphodiesterase